MLKFSTAGESHGEALITVLSGVPAGLSIDAAFVDRELWRRQQGFGRGGRMRIEKDTAHILSGVRQGKTIGSPISIQLENQDWKNWQESLPVQAGDPGKHKAVASPRPGHADLAGALKYDLPEARYVLERASARESAARVAGGAIAKLLLRELGMDVLSHVIAVGRASLPKDLEVSWSQLQALHAKNEVLLNCADPATEEKMKAEVDAVLRTGDSLGGIFEVVAHGVPPGLGTYANWDERLDAQLAAAVMSLQAVKAVEIGRAIEAAISPGSAVHDEIGYDRSAGREAFTGFTRSRNNAGGLEGGVSNGQDIVMRGYLKPISTLRRPLKSVDFATREEVKAAYERSDVCVVPAAGVAGEAMVALVLAMSVLEKFGGDSMKELSRNFQGYREQIKNF
ncbi:MAG TPA: chorismate synthase [Terriglobales bacterium]|nr:chorismate synthase [Terriglobales bacterium]